MKTNKTHLIAVSQALLVTFLWSTSWVFIKIGLESELPAVTFAGLRYTLAAFCLLPFAILNPTHRQTLRELPARTWWELTGLGIIFYTLTQGAQFVSLSFLPSATLSLLLNFSPIFIAIYGMISHSESTSLTQWGGILVTVIGALIYFAPLSIEEGQIIGLLAGLVALSANAASSIFGRYINTQEKLNPLVVTSVSMGIGGIIMLIIGNLTQGMGRLNLTQWAIIGWLAIINTAIAFTLWNKSLQTLTAVESSIINGTMLPQIAILAWIFLGEPLGGKEILGLIFVLIGTLIVQLWRYLPTSER
ncbi:MAG: DMT family transporter [Anaerolineales bacterium]|uniref:DMT family transporter n=1 Tax=Candidatus Villigracilis vicinus TaxID=3140679 RepID=UPI003135D857|nr:DMT family transporter [Anaerolineales bacterium]